MNSVANEDVQRIIERVWSEQWGRLLGLLVAQTRRLDLAEDALAGAFEQAVRRWPDDGTPSNPSGWLFTTARRRILDQLRAEAVVARKMPLLAIEGAHRQPEAVMDPANAPDAADDDLLRLAMLSAHPALAPEAGSALTLRLVLGVSTADIARLFLVSESTMAARLTRARKKVVAAGIPFAIPEPEALNDRLDTLAQVAYLAFTAGYAPGSGSDVVRGELAGEAIRLVRLLRAPAARAERRDHSATLDALLALMLLQHSRREARSDDDGRLVLLPDQDRTTWRHDEIAEATALLAALVGERRALTLPSLQAASYTLQAAIAAEHTRAATASDTDWVVISDLYRQLDDLTGSPVVRMNRAVAVAEAGDLDAALTLLAQIPADREPPRIAAVRAELLSRAGRFDDALRQFEVALDQAGNDAERELLSGKAAELRRSRPAARDGR